MNKNNEKLKIHYTCTSCQSGNEVYFPSKEDVDGNEIFKDQCHICKNEQTITAHSDENKNNELHVCCICDRKDFYQQKDFNRKLGVALFIIAAVLSIWTYGVSLIILYLIDLFLFSRIGNVVVCYKCNTLYRNVANISEIQPFNHEMHDRIVYSGHDFHGKPLSH